MKRYRFDVTYKPNRMIKAHFHNFCEIYYQAKGEKFYFIKNETYHLLPGDLVLIKENVVHKAFAPNLKENVRYYIEIERDYLKEQLPLMETESLFDCFDQEVFFFRLKSKDQLIIYDIMKKLEENSGSIDSSPIRQLNLTLELLLLINEKIKEDESLDPRQSSMNPHIYKATCFINDHYMQDISLTSLALYLNIDKYYLSKLFKVNTGFTLSDYLNTTRIRHASERLLSSQESVSHIAQAVGYSDISYFGKVFKKLMGLSPLKYRHRQVK